MRDSSFGLRFSSFEIRYLMFDIQDSRVEVRVSRLENKKEPAEQGLHKTPRLKPATSAQSPSSKASWQCRWPRHRTLLAEVPRPRTQPLPRSPPPSRSVVDSQRIIQRARERGMNITQTQLAEVGGGELRLKNVVGGGGAQKKIGLRRGRDQCNRRFPLVSE